MRLPVTAVLAGLIWSGALAESNPQRAVCPCCGHVLPPGYLIVTNAPVPADPVTAPAVPAAVAAVEPPAVSVPAVEPVGAGADPALKKETPRDWKASMAGGFSAKSGNANERSYRYGGEFDKRKGTEYRYKLKADGRYSKTEEQTSASKAELSGEGRKLLQDRWFVSGRLSALHDDVKDISYRTKIGPGVGRYLVDSERLTADVSTGPLYIREKTPDELTDYIAWRLAQRIDWRLSDTFVAWIETELITDVSNEENFQVACKAGVDSRINDHLSLIVELENEYDNMPDEDVNEKNDMEISTGVRYRF